jgi:hypothetical protein
VAAKSIAHTTHLNEEGLLLFMTRYFTTKPASRGKFQPAFNFAFFANINRSRPFSLYGPFIFGRTAKQYGYSARSTHFDRRFPNKPPEISFLEARRQRT